MENPRILIIDDEQSVHHVITAYLKAEGYEYQSAMDGRSGWELAMSFKPHIIVLDVMLPGMDGIQLMTNLRRESDVYVIMLSARTEEVDKIIGLSVGADDYLSKPFSPRELIARIKAALRRIQNSVIPAGDENELTFRHIRISQKERRVWVEGRLIDLTTVEFDILVILAQYHGQVLSRQQLLEKVWGYDYYGDTRVVDVHVGHVRQKVGNDTYIETVRGVGYRFEDK